MSVSKEVMPEGCSLVVIETSGGAHKWDVTRGEIFEYKKLSNSLIKRPDTKDMFIRPREYSSELNDIFGSVAIYEPGDRYPQLKYDLLLDWPTLGDIRYSGLIPFEIFVSSDFTTQNIATKLITEHGESYLNDSYANNENWLHNMMEIYKYSEYPSPYDYRNYFSNLEGRRELVYKLEKPAKSENDLDDFDSQTKNLFNRYFRKITLESLMEKFPGHYIHMVCRTTSETSKGFTYNPHPDLDNATEEVVLKRVQYMTPTQISRGIKHIEKSKRNNTPSKFEVRSSRKMNNIMMTGFRRSLLHDEFRRKTPRIRAIREIENYESDNSNENNFYIPRINTINKPKTKKKTYNRSRNYKLKFKSRA